MNAERAAESGFEAADVDLECIPTTFILPSDYSLFAEEFRKQEHAGDADDHEVELVPSAAHVRVLAVTGEAHRNDLRAHLAEEEQREEEIRPLEPPGQLRLRVKPW